MVVVRRANRGVGGGVAGPSTGATRHRRQLHWGASRMGLSSAGRGPLRGSRPSCGAPGGVRSTPVRHGRLSSVAPVGPPVGVRRGRAVPPPGIRFARSATRGPFYAPLIVGVASNSLPISVARTTFLFAEASGGHVDPKARGGPIARSPEPLFHPGFLTIRSSRLRLSETACRFRAPRGPPRRSVSLRRTRHLVSRRRTGAACARRVDGTGRLPPVRLKPARSPTGTDRRRLERPPDRPR